LPVKIRLSRVGRNKIAKYRVVAADSRSARDGRFIEQLGNYDPSADPKKFEFNAERVAYWIKVGGQPTQTVQNLLLQDRFYEKQEGLEKGLTAEQLNLTRKPERKRKPKAKKEKKS